MIYIISKYVDLNNDKVIYTGEDGEYSRYNIPVNDVVEQVVPVEQLRKYQANIQDLMKTCSPLSMEGLVYQSKIEAVNEIIARYCH